MWSKQGSPLEKLKCKNLNAVVQSNGFCEILIDVLTKGTNKFNVGIGRWKVMNINNKNNKVILI